MHPRLPLGVGGLVGGLLFVVSCTGPEAPSRTEEDPRVYHVQLAMTEEKAEADRILGRALEWWEAHEAELPSRSQTAAEDVPVRVVWKAPLYRLRLGPFASRAQAEAVLERSSSTFSEAFVVPDRGPTQ